jgi:uncharacterized protein involved in response to NO
MTTLATSTLTLRRRAAAERRFPLLELGFRPFFLLAAAFASVGVPLWLVALHGGLQPGGGFGAMQWHAHEMLFGFTTAVIAGFLLTATSNWTGRRTATGPALAALAALWVLGRVAMFFAVFAPRSAAVVDVAFLPSLAAVCAVPIVASKSARNYVFIVLLLLLAALNAGAHAAAWRADLGAVRDFHGLTLDIVVVMLVLVTGRVVPSFTRNATRASTVASSPGLERAALVAVVAVTALDALHRARTPVENLTPAVAALSASAALLLGARMRRWGSWYARRDPLVWILHFGSAWLPLGFALRAGSLFVPAIPAGSALHALTAGAIGSSTLGMMARVSLGHTGRMLWAARGVHVAFVCVAIAAIARVSAPWLPSRFYLAALDGAGVAWSCAFGLFFVMHVRMLTSPRVDGR